MPKIPVTQVSRVERWIDIEVDDVEPYLDGDFETPPSSDPRWADQWDLQHEEVEVL